jgi:hypothetical protein
MWKAQGKNCEKSSWLWLQIYSEKNSALQQDQQPKVCESIKSLEADCFGHVIRVGQQVAFLKEVPSKVEETLITKHGVSKDRKSFFKINMDISNSEIE